MKENENTTCQNLWGEVGVPWWPSGLRIWHCHCFGSGHCLWHGFDSWPREFLHATGMAKRKKKIMGRGKAVPRGNFIAVNTYIKEAGSWSSCLMQQLTSIHEDVSGYLVSMRTQVQSLVSLSGLSIQRCRELWCRSQTQLRSHTAVAVV